jgi:glycerol-3-phosphate dehydrogenase
VFVLPQGRGLVHRYGTEAPVVAALGVEPVVEGRPETVGELPFAVRAEGARSVADLLDRRTRIGLVTAERARAEPVAEAVLAEP